MLKLSLLMTTIFKKIFTIAFSTYVIFLNINICWTGTVTKMANICEIYSEVDHKSIRENFRILILELGGVLLIPVFIASNKIICHIFELVLKNDN